MGKYDTLKIENQLCFPLYAASREIIKRYKPHLDKLDLTYTQYITMMVIWEKRSISVKELGEVLFLDSGTLTPVLKKLEAKGYITRHRSEKDERVLIVSVTDEGTRLRDEALTVPQAVGRCVRLGKDEADALYKLLYTLINTMEEE
ncbi:MAG: MarR family transcriptional regulator [Clostridia bacterium]|nr:MarR family transcriptional regulator [Clostridia bacterium]MBQ3461769.1 MarR family transcriptional regulator [Clostridia bacterium]MBQ6531330.1 MarR family transcriptional regulator [Clostridia bacterium]MBQ6558766.1 MarR family transcriptional regulator [Clostridia bacterium]